MNNSHIKKHIIIAIFINMIIILSLATPVISEGGNQYGQESAYENKNNSQPSEKNNYQNNPSDTNYQYGNENNKDITQESWNEYQKQGNQNKNGHQQNRYNYRRVNCTGDHNKFKIRSQCRFNNSIDLFDINFITDPEPSLILDYMPNGDAENIQITFKITLKKIVEFLDLNGNSRYDYGDLEIDAYLFSLVNFTNITYSNITIDSEQNILNMSTQTIDGVFGLNMYLSDNLTNIKNQVLYPSEMKIDFLINHYPYQKNNSLLALLVEISTDNNITYDSQLLNKSKDYVFNESAFNISSMHYAGFFSWLNTVKVDGLNKSINVSIFEEKISEIDNSNKSRYIIFSYPHGTEIYHDPKIGVFSNLPELIVIDNSQLINISIYLSYIISCIFALIIFIGFIALRKRLYY